jgi:hypothetical protein
VLVRLALRFGKLPDEIATRRWSVLKQWWAEVEAL